MGAVLYYNKLGGIHLATLEVSYHRKVNLGNYSNVDLGGTVTFETEEPMVDYTDAQEVLKSRVDALADRIMSEATLSKRS